MPEAKTWVCWDIDCCPVPDGYDSRLVVSSIEWALWKKGYWGPVTITAVGNLKLTLKRSPHVLPALSAAGVHLGADFVCQHICDEFIQWKKVNQAAPATLLVIGGYMLYKYLSRWFSPLQGDGHTILHAHPQAYPQANEKSFVWESLLEDKCCLPAAGESGFKFFCALCELCPGESFEDFTTHLNSKDHVILEFNTFRPSPKRTKKQKPFFILSDYKSKADKWRFEDDRRSLWRRTKKNKSRGG